MVNYRRYSLLYQINEVFILIFIAIYYIGIFFLFFIRQQILPEKCNFFLR